MTDEELMQQALDALEVEQTIYLYQKTGVPDYITIPIKALRDRLSQQEHDDPIGDAQEKLIAEQASQPQMQPCAGRNCGSTNPNLHSAECFEDYDKATGADSNRTWTQAHWTEYEHSIVAAEREAIAQSLDKQADLAADEIDRQWAQEMAAAVRARGKA